MRMGVLFFLFVTMAFVRAIIQVAWEKTKKIPEKVVVVISAIHLVLSAIVAFVMVLEPSSSNTRYYANGVNVTSFVDNPISTFFVMFVVMGGLFFAIPWGLCELAYHGLLAMGIVGNKEQSKRSLEGILALASMWVAIIAFPASIILITSIGPVAAVYILIFAFLCGVPAVVSSIIIKRKNMKIFARAIIGMVGAGFYLLIPVLILIRVASFRIMN